MAAPAESDGDLYQRADTALWRRVADRVVLLPAEGDGDVLTLSGSGPVLWDLLEGAWTFAKLVEHLGTSFSIEPARVAADIEPVLEDLVRRGLVTRGAT